MAINDNATLAIDSGNYLTAVTGTALPTDLTAPPVAWEKVGHTSLDDIMSVKSDGGDTTILGTLQNRNLRTRRGSRSEAFNFTLQQFDSKGLQLYYGSNSKKLTDGTYSVPVQPLPTTCAFLAIFLDGTNVFAFYAPKAEIFRGDDIDLKDTESLAGLPLVVTPLQYQTNDWLYSVTPLGEVSGG